METVTSLKFMATCNTIKTNDILNSVVCVLSLVDSVNVNAELPNLRKMFPDLFLM